MTPQNPRGPQPAQPSEPGWWLASDGMWYPPESAPGYVAPTEPTPPPALEPTPPPTPEFTPPPTEGPATFASMNEAGAPVPPPFVPGPAAAAPGAPSVPAPGDVVAQPVKESNGAAVTSLIFGIVSFFCIPFIGGLVAIFTGVAGKKKPNGRGMAITGIVLGSINVVLSIVAVIAIVAAGVFAANNADELVGVADPSTYDITVDSCRISISGTATAQGVVSNTTSKTKNFLVVMEFEDKASGEAVENAVPVTGIRAREDADYTVTTTQLPRSTRSITCRVKEVRNLIN